MSKCVPKMWPLKLDMSKDECRGVLRRLGEKCVIKFFFSQKAKQSQNKKNQNAKIVSILQNWTLIRVS